MSNPYNWPFPSRKDLMSLQTITRHDAGTSKPQKIQGEDYNLKVEDIHGAKPCLKPYLYVNKETYVNRIDDIQGTRSRAMLPSKDREPQRGLQCDDIKGAKPQLNKFVTNRAPTNPVEPVYVIPKSVPIQVTPPKFIRDQIDIRVDIPGTKPFPPYAKLRKQVYQFDEIEGTKSKPNFIPRDHIEILDVKDINEYRQFKSTRVTNPLEPTYKMRNDQSEQVEFGFVDGSKSRQLHPGLNKPQSTSLITKDIEGCKVEAITDHFLMRNKRKDFRQINNTTDLPQTQVGSLHKGLGHIRGTNPLNPNYQFPGRSEIQPQQHISRQLSANFPRPKIEEQAQGDNSYMVINHPPSQNLDPPPIKVDPFFHPPRNNNKSNINFNNFEGQNSKAYDVKAEQKVENNNMSNNRPEKIAFSKYDPKDTSQRQSSAQRIERFIQK